MPWLGLYSVGQLSCVFGTPSPSMSVTSQTSPIPSPSLSSWLAFGTAGQLSHRSPSPSASQSHWPLAARPWFSQKASRVQVVPSLLAAPATQTPPEQTPAGSFGSNGGSFGQSSEETVPPPLLSRWGMPAGL